MKKKKVFENVLLMFIVASILLMCIPVVYEPVLGFVLEKVVFPVAEPFISKAFDEFEEERQKAIENKEPFPGRDTKIIWGKMYDISDYSGNVILTILNKEIDEDVLGNIRNFEKVDGKLYIVSDDGYAVINEENVCRLYVTLTEEEFEKGYREDANGEKIPCKKHVDYEKIVYLNSFEEFFDSEQKILKKLSARQGQ